MDKIQGPYTYDAQEPKDIKFKPLRAQNMVSVRAELVVYFFLALCPRRTTGSICNTVEKNPKYHARSLTPLGVLLWDSCCWLAQSKEYTADELMVEYEKDLQLKKFLHIIKVNDSSCL